MKNIRTCLIASLTAALVCGASFAQEKADRYEFPLAISLLPSVELPTADYDILGLRFGLLASEHANVSLIDLNVIAAFTDKEELGLQISGIYNRIGKGAGVLQLGGLANDSRGAFVGGQISAFYNRSSGEVSGLSLGALNISDGLNGLQVGIVNRTGVLEGLQVGVVNYADEAEGLQIGVINVMRDGKWPALPIVNFGF